MERASNMKQKALFIIFKGLSVVSDVSQMRELTFKYLENQTSFQDEIKSVFQHVSRAIIEANKKFFGR